ncbi:FAD-dependent pyridine nucleotide-disulphide oxidoreductase (plasmid) [Azospirillum sp. B510]|uniref:NAD(P)/FAD-dependent oxidoreductase n=1 Tax=Azospirillum sp. (strain B510) TaxID=137722 RepID=UPI0001C4CB94|nr:FAD-dependent oxidoreductase [Azospirillum sp. B510]BAI74837.1 FAD-dependent pyridine nucleotide-disulphide oxidoreductase [Azospirillum sp. B510]
MGETSILIVGAGHAAGELATSLRQGGFAGRITMIGEEPYLPYQRPPLSKAFLAGEVEVAGLHLKPQATYDRAGIEVLAGVRAVWLDRVAKSVALDDGRTLSYDRLVLATGGRARRLAVPGAAEAEAAGVLHYLRTIDDVRRIQAGFLPGRRLAIVGGGYVGLEVAAVAAKRGVAVTVLESALRVLARVTSPEMSAFYEEVHRDAGVRIRKGVTVTGVTLQTEGGGLAVTCADGVPEPADLTIVGIGLEPNVELARDAGLAVDDGIVVDEFTRTSDPDVFAIGDCTNHPNPLLGRRLRLESVPNAMEQARAAAAALCGKPKPYASIPWFWSEQYDLKLQMVGLSAGYDQCVLRGDPARRFFTAFYGLAGRLIAAHCVSRPQEFMICRRLVEQGIAIDVARMADEGVPLKNLLEATSVA